MAKAQKDLDYTLEPEVLHKVKEALNGYYRANIIASEEVSDDDYEYYPTSKYGTEPTVYSATPSRKTESLAIEILEKKIRQRDAKNIVDGIDRGLLRAAMTVKSDGMVKSYNEALRSHLIDRIPNRPHILDIVPNTGKHRRISMRRDTLRMYKKRAFYFIAVELHLIEASPDILRAEREPIS